MLIAYVPQIFRVWAYSDELDIFDDKSLGEHVRRDGNLVSALIYNQITTRLINSVSDLWMLRIISLVSLLLAFNILAQLISKTNKSNFPQLILPIALLLPSPMTYILWGGIWIFSISLLISLVACTLWLYAGVIQRAISPLLLCISMLIYPISAFSSLSFMAMLFVLCYQTNTHFFLIIKKLLQLYSLSGFISLFTLAIFANTRNYEFNERVSLVDFQSLPQKIYWVISRPMAVSSRFFDIRSPSAVDAFLVFAFVMLVVLFGLRRQSKELNDSSLIRIFLFFVAVFLSLTPLIISSSNQIEFRYLFGVSVCFLITTSHFIAVFLQTFSANSKYLLVLFLMVIGVLSMIENSNRQFIVPYQSKMLFFSSEIDRCLSQPVKFSNIIVTPPKKPFPSRPNIGMFSQTTDLASEWVPIPSLKVILREKGLIYFDVMMGEEQTSGSKNRCEINLEGYRDFIDEPSN